METTNQRILRRLSGSSRTDVASPASSDSPRPKQSKEELKLLATAAELGFCCIPMHKVMKSLVHAIARRLKQRTTTNVYQCVTFNLAPFPRSVAESIFPDALLTRSSLRCKTWTMNSMASVVQVFAPLLADQTLFVGGVSKALMTASQQWSRVIATMISAEVSWVEPANGVDHLHMNFMYVISDETGEVHPPKDAARREIALSSSVMEAIRQRVLIDAAILAEKGVPLSAGWFCQLGQYVKAMEVRALQANLAASSRAALSSFAHAASGGSSAELNRLRRCNRRADMFEVQSIVEAETRGRTRGMWVQWAGYSPDWEAWRVEGRGLVGQSLVTWEPEYNLRNTEAYIEWMQQM